jgi:hypothetical protein
MDSVRGTGIGEVRQVGRWNELKNNKKEKKEVGRWTA